jgi:hypothetical protein
MRSAYSSVVEQWPSKPSVSGSTPLKRSFKVFPPALKSKQMNIQLHIIYNNPPKYITSTTILTQMMSTKKVMASVSGGSDSIVCTSPMESPWDSFFRVLNPEWFSRSPFSVETTYDVLTVMLIFFIISIIVIFYMAWSSYFGNTMTSFLIGDKKLPVFHLALISVAVLVSVLTVSLIYVIAFTTLMVEAVSLEGLSSEITRLDAEIQNLRSLLEVHSKED